MLSFGAHDCALQLLQRAPDETFVGALITTRAITGRATTTSCTQFEGRASENNNNKQRRRSSIGSITVCARRASAACVGARRTLIRVVATRGHLARCHCTVASSAPITARADSYQATNHSRVGRTMWSRPCDRARKLAGLGARAVVGAVVRRSDALAQFAGLAPAPICAADSPTRGPVAP